MILQWITLIGMIAFCIWHFVGATNVPGTAYLPVIYIICPILLVVGLGKRGIITWPLATILLLIEGHWIVGWIPAALVTFTIIGNQWLDKKHPTTCQICNRKFEEGEEIVNYRGVHVHAGECFQKLMSESGSDAGSSPC